MVFHMARLHLHLLSDSTGETLEMIAKAALSQFDDSAVTRHFWPMVRSQAHLDRIFGDIAAHPGLVLYTMVSQDIRKALENRCRALGLPAVPALDAVIDALEMALVEFGEIARFAVLPDFSHGFTHYKLQVKPVQVELLQRFNFVGQNNYQWVPLRGIAHAALPAPVKKLLLALTAI
jgi:hypothetical protein